MAFTGHSLPPLRDDFERPDSGSLGASWAEGTFGFGTGLAIAGGRVASPGGNEQAAHWTGLSAMRLAVAAELAVLDATDYAHFLMARSARQDAGYIAYLAQGPGIVEVWTATAGVYALDTTIPISQSFASGDLLGMLFEDDGQTVRLTVYRKAGSSPWAAIGSGVLATRKAGPYYPGLGLYQTTTGRMDDFRAADADATPLRTGPHWTFAATNRSGVLAASLDPEQVKLTVRLSSFSELAGAIDARSSAAVEIVPAAAAIRAWRNGVLRFNGQVVEPVDRGLDLVAFKACDPFYFLSNRRRETKRVFTATDAGAIARALVDDERARETLHLRNAATFPNSVNRDRTYERGKQIGEAIRELADARDGFYFRIDPVDAGADMGELVILYPDSGQNRPGAVFFSTDSGANVESPHEILGLPRTRVVTVGAQDPATGAPVLGEAEDAAGRAAYGLIEDEIAYTDVAEPSLLDDLALEALYPEPPRTYKVSPIAYSEAGPYVPALFDDFTVGDRVRIRIKRNAIDVDTWARVTEATLVVSDHGRTERIESLVLETA